MSYNVLVITSSELEADREYCRFVDANLDDIKGFHTRLKYILLEDDTKIIFRGVNSLDILGMTDISQVFVTQKASHDLRVNTIRCVFCGETIVPPEFFVQVLAED